MEPLYDPEDQANGLLAAKRGRRQAQPVEQSPAPERLNDNYVSPVVDDFEGEEDYYDDYYEDDYQDEPDDDLRRIFEYYAAYGEPLPTAELHASKFYKLCRDCRILDNNITYPDIDLLFLRCTRISEDKKKTETAGAAFCTMSYEQFVDALEVLAVKKWPGTNPLMALEKLLQQHVLPLAGRRAPDEVCENLLVPELMDIFRRFKRPLQAIFMSYCARNKIGAKAGWDSIARSNVTMSIGKFLLFAREFDMLPHIITKQAVVKIFRAANLSPENSDEGLNYSEFTETLGRIALFWYSRQDSRVPGDGGEQLSDKVLTLLAVMDESEGMLNVLESMGHTHSKAYSLQLSHGRSTPAKQSMRADALEYPSQLEGTRTYSKNSSLRFASSSQTRPASASGVRFTSTLKPTVGASQGSSMFKSKTPRCQAFKPKEVTPSPGLYDPPKPKWGGGKSGAYSTSTRFPNRKAQAINTYYAQRLEPTRRRN